jgi:hypothetical protein
VSAGAYREGNIDWEMLDKCSMYFIKGLFMFSEAIVAIYLCRVCTKDTYKDNARLDKDGTHLLARHC